MSHLYCILYTTISYNTTQSESECIAHKHTRTPSICDCLWHTILRCVDEIRFNKMQRIRIVLLGLFCCSCIIFLFSQYFFFKCAVCVCSLYNSRYYSRFSQSYELLDCVSHKIWISERSRVFGLFIIANTINGQTIITCEVRNGIDNTLRHTTTHTARTHGATPQCVFGVLCIRHRDSKRGKYSNNNSSNNYSRPAKSRWVNLKEAARVRGEIRKKQTAIVFFFAWVEMSLSFCRLWLIKRLSEWVISNSKINFEMIRSYFRIQCLTLAK